MNKLIYAVIVVLVTTTMPVFAQGIGWGIVNAKIHSEFPDVPRMQTSELADILNKAKEQKPLLLDVRTKAEFDVSHLAAPRVLSPASTSRSCRCRKTNRSSPIALSATAPPRWRRSYGTPATRMSRTSRVRFFGGRTRIAHWSTMANRRTRFILTMAYGGCSWTRRIGLRTRRQRRR